MINQVFIVDQYQQDHQRLLGRYQRQGYTIEDVLVSQDGLSCVIDITHETKKTATGNKPYRLTVHVTYTTGFIREIEKV